MTDEREVLIEYHTPEGMHRRLVKGPHPLEKEYVEESEQNGWLMVETSTAAGWRYAERLGMIEDD